MEALRKSGVPTVCSFVCRQRPWRGRHQGCRIARKKLYFREIYACGGGLLVAPINALCSILVTFVITRRTWRVSILPCLLCVIPSSNKPIDHPSRASVPTHIVRYMAQICNTIKRIFVCEIMTTYRYCSWSALMTRYALVADVSPSVFRLLSFSWSHLEN